MFIDKLTGYLPHNSSIYERNESKLLQSLRAKLQSAKCSLHLTVTDIYEEGKSPNNNLHDAMS